ATDFMNRHKWTSETPSLELAKYTEEINESLKDDCKVQTMLAGFMEVGMILIANIYERIPEEPDKDKRKNGLTIIMICI
ncbi:1330_t:CDS:2, partial [Funneliformis geosporum]